MREIKFRAWHYDAVEMLHEDLPGDVFRWKNEGQPIVIEQFTGLQDKNSKEIYEGDIVRLGDELYEIIYEVGDFNVGFRKKSGNLTDIGMEFSRKLEIIGNIHENPNLLKETK